MSSIPPEYDGVKEAERILGYTQESLTARRFRPNGTPFYPGLDGEPQGLYEGDPIKPTTFYEEPRPSRGIVDRCVDAIVQAFKRLR